MENIFRCATLDDQTFIKETHPIRYRAGRALLASDHQHGEGCKKSSVQNPKKKPYLSKGFRLKISQETTDGDDTSLLGKKTILDRNNDLKCFLRFLCTLLVVYQSSFFHMSFRTERSGVKNLRVSCRDSSPRSVRPGTGPRSVRPRTGLALSDTCSIHTWQSTRDSISIKYI
jgi:hypothetical protein